MQDFSLTTGKTLTELTALTQDTVCGDFNYNAENHLLYEKEWHSIDPNGVIKPSETQHYFYKDQQLKTDPKYCGKLYWKMCAQVWTRDIERTKIIANYNTMWNDQNSAVFNNKNTILATFKGIGAGTSMDNFLATSKKIDDILNVKYLTNNFNLIKGLQKATPTTDYNFLYSTQKTTTNGSFYLYQKSVGHSEHTSIFGQYIGTTNAASTQPFVSCTGGSEEIINIEYSQPENGTDSDNFYNLFEYSTIPGYQALPLGIGIYAGVATKNAIVTPATQERIIPFMCFCIGITETPTEA